MNGIGRWIVSLSAALVAAIALANFALMTLDLAPAAPVPVAKIVVFTPEMDVQIEKGNSMFVKSPDWLWDLKPGAATGTDTINADGFRGPRVAPRKTPQRLRIGVLGESGAYGSGVQEQQCWPRRLEAILRGEGIDCEVVNFAVPGHTTPLSAVRWLRRLHAYEPDVLLVAHMQNSDAMTAYSDLTDMDKVIRLANPEFAFDKVLERVGLYRWILEKSGVEMAAATAGGRPRATLEQVDKSLEAIATSARTRGAKVAILLSPLRLDAFTLVQTLPQFQQTTIRAAARLKVPLIDLGQAFKAAIASGRVKVAEDPTQSILFHDPFNPSFLGHELIARTLRDQLRQWGWVR